MTVLVDAECRIDACDQIKFQYCSTRCIDVEKALRRSARRFAFMRAIAAWKRPRSRAKARSIGMHGRRASRATMSVQQ